MSCQDAIIINLALLIFPLHALAWNIPGHMLSGAIAYQILQRENPSTIARVRSILENNPWYETRWKAQLDKQLESDRNEMLFMLAARWADDIRTLDKAESLCGGTTWTSRSSQKASQQASRPCSRSRRISSQQ